MTLTIEDALMSSMSFAMLSGAGVVEGSKENGQKVYIHTTYDLPVQGVNGTDGYHYVELDEETRNGDRVFVSQEAPIYGMVLNSAGGTKAYLSAIKTSEITIGETYADAKGISRAGELVPAAGESIFFEIATGSNISDPDVVVGDVVRIDCYTVHDDGAMQINIDAENFAGYYYIEADTLFRDEATGKDFPAEFVIPRGKIQSNFTFTMASSGDPSTFSFAIDAFPAYTAFSKSKKVLCQLNIIDPTVDKHNYGLEDIRGHQHRKGDDDVFGNGDATDANDKPWFGESIFEEGFWDGDGVATKNQ